MPNVGELEVAYGRQYRYVKPNATDPGTYRLATPEGGSSGAGGGGLQDIDSELPIVATTVTVPNTKTTISLDITQLPSRY